MFTNKIKKSMRVALLALGLGVSALSIAVTGCDEVSGLVEGKADARSTLFSGGAGDNHAPPTPGFCCWNFARP